MFFFYLNVLYHHERKLKNIRLHAAESYRFLIVSGYVFFLPVVIMPFERLLQTLFFGDLFSVEAKTLVLRLSNYIIYKVASCSYFDD